MTIYQEREPKNEIHINKINTYKKTIVKDSPLMGKNSILTKWQLLLTLAQPCIRFMRRSLRWRILVVNI